MALVREKKDFKFLLQQDIHLYRPYPVIFGYPYYLPQMTQNEAARPPASKRSNAARLFGYDIFISFALGRPPRGTRGYASDLARKLRDLDFTVFFSEDEAPPGNQLDATLARALSHSRILVIIANRATLESPRWVRVEVEEFRKRNPGRPVIPISIDGALEDVGIADSANEWLQYRDKIWIDESAAAAESASVSDEVLARLATAPSSTRASLRWRRVVRLVMASLVALSSALAYAWWVAVDNAAKARAELRRSAALRLAAEAQNAMAARSASEDERALLEVLAAHRIYLATEVDRALLTSLHQRRALLKLIPVGTAVAAVAFHPDNRRVAAGTLELALNGDNSLRLWEIATGQRSGSAFPRLAQPYLSVEFSPDGAITATGNGDARLRIWKTETRALLGEPLPGSESETVNSVAFSRDGSRLVSGSNDGLLAVWDVARRVPVAGPSKQGNRAILSVAISPDSERIATAGSDGAVRLWEPRSLKPIASHPMKHGGVVNGVAFSPDGRMIASGGADKAVRMWDSRTGAPVGNPMMHDAAVKGLAFSPDGLRLASVGDDRTVRLWDIRTRRLMSEPLQGHSKAAWAVAFSRDGSLIASGGEDGTLRLWEGRVARTLARSLVEALKPMALVYTPDGKLTVAIEKGWIVDVDQRSRRSIALPGDVDLSKLDLRMQAFSADGRRVAVVAMDESIRVFDVKTGERFGTAVTVTEGVRSIALNADGTRLAIADGDKAIRLWDVSSGQTIGQAMRGHDSDINALVFSPDGTRLASGAGGFWSQDNGVRLWDTSPQAPAPIGKPLVGHRSAVRALAFSPDGRRIVSAGGDAERNDYSIRQWDIASRRQLGAPIEGHVDTVLALAFSGDGRLILSGGRDRDLRLWDAATGQPVGPPLHVHDTPITHIAIAADNSQIATSAHGGQLLLWPGPAAWPGELCAKLTRNMSRQEWRDWVSPEIDYICQCPVLPIPADDPGSSAKPEMCSNSRQDR
jgi:WD40 repeat protein